MKRSTVIVLSFALNLALVAWIGWLMARPLPTPTPQTLESNTSATAPLTVVHTITNSGPVLPASPPFHWSQVESTNYSNYISNLRGLACPELTIRRIITGELDELYTQRRQLMLAPWQSQLWDQAARGLRSPLKWMEEMKPIEAELRQNAKKLQDEKAQVLQALLGDPPKAPATEERKRPPAPDYLAEYLTEEKQRQVMDLEAKFNQLTNQANQKNRRKPAAERTAAIEDLKRQKLEAIQGVLTPEEYAEYRLRSSRAASLRYQAYNFDASPEEWQALVRTKMEHDEAYPVTTGSSAQAQERQTQLQEARQKLDEQYKSILGAERYEAFRRSQDGDYQQIARVVERCELPDTTAAQAFEIKRAAQASARTIVENSALSQEQQQAALEAIRRETENALTQSLGERAFKTYSRYGGEWLNHFSKPGPS